MASLSSRVNLALAARHDVHLCVEVSLELLELKLVLVHRGLKLVNEVLKLAPHEGHVGVEQPAIDWPALARELPALHRLLDLGLHSWRTGEATFRRGGLFLLLWFVLGLVRLGAGLARLGRGPKGAQLWLHRRLVVVLWNVSAPTVAAVVSVVVVVVFVDVVGVVLESLFRLLHEAARCLFRFLLVDGPEDLADRCPRRWRQLAFVLRLQLHVVEAKLEASRGFTDLRVLLELRERRTFLARHQLQHEREHRKIVFSDLHLGLVREVYLHIRVRFLLQHCFRGDELLLLHIDHLRRLRLYLRKVGKVTRESCDLGHHLLECHTVLVLELLTPNELVIQLFPCLSTNALRYFRAFAREDSANGWWDL